MIEKKQIENEEDIKLLIHQFYAKVRKDDLLGPVFNEVVKGNWDCHLQIMCDFWSTMVLHTHKYTNNALAKHMPLSIESAHFDQWLLLFQETVDELYIGYNASNAKDRAITVARVIKNAKGIAA